MAKNIFTSGGISAVGVVTASGADISGSIDVDGQTELDDLNVVGVAIHIKSTKSWYWRHSIYIT